MIIRAELGFSIVVRVLPVSEPRSGQRRAWAQER